MAGDPPLERFHPLLMHSLLTAVRRFEPDFYNHLCRAHHVDADRILGLFSEVDQLGGGQLAAILAELRMHQAYHEIVYLAGRNAALQYAEQQHAHPAPLLPPAARFGGLCKQLLPAFLGQASYVLMVRGELQFIELRDSLFARDVAWERPLCGFYCGMLAELGTMCIQGAAVATELRCRAVDPDSLTCLIQVSL